MFWQTQVQSLGATGQQQQYHGSMFLGMNDEWSQNTAF
jgi:hypothetical protein